MIHRLLSRASIFMLIFVSTWGVTAHAISASVPRQIVAYFASWDAYGRNYNPAQIPVDKVTVINYAFARLTFEGDCAIGDVSVDMQKRWPGDTSNEPGALHGNFFQLLQMRKANPSLGLSISIGGWSWSDSFSRAARSSESRRKTVASCIDMFINGKLPGIDSAQAKGLFDGIDIDWEYPACCGMLPAGSLAYSPQDKQNYTLLLQEFRRQLDIQGAADGVHYRLTAAVPAGSERYGNIDLKAAADPLDWYDLMTYDYNGAWEKTTGFNAPLYAPDNSDLAKQNNVDSAVQAYLSAGVPASKIVLGVPFYSHSWQGAPDTNHGLGQTASAIPKGTWDDASSGNTGIYDYADIAAHYVANPAYKRYWSDAAQAPWLYNATDGTFISYDDPQSLAVKADYVNKLNLGGMMLWEISSDNGDLINTLASKLRP